MFLINIEADNKSTWFLFRHIWVIQLLVEEQCESPQGEPHTFLDVLCSTIVLHVFIYIFVTSGKNSNRKLRKGFLPYQRFSVLRNRPVGGAT